MDDTKGDVASKILDYLRKNPDAGDTLEGIAKWWLEMERVNHGVEQVSIALESLIKEGIIERHKINGDNSTYRICRKT